MGNVMGCCQTKAARGGNGRRKLDGVDDDADPEVPLCRVNSAWHGCTGEGQGRVDVDAVVGGEVPGVSTTCDYDVSVLLTVEVPLLLFSYEDAKHRMKMLSIQKNNGSGW